MTRRSLIVESPTSQGRSAPTRVHIDVDMQDAIGPWINTVAAQMGYPLVDAFGAPLSYRLRSPSGIVILPTLERFDEAPFPSESCFVLEPDPAGTILLQEHPDLQAGSARLSRRSLLDALTSLSLLGLGAGMTTALVDQFFSHPVPTPKAIQIPTLVVQHQRPVRALTWSHDGQMLASAGDDRCILVCTADGQRVYQQIFPDPIQALAWSLDSMHLLAGMASTVIVLDARTGAQLAKQANVHTGMVTAVGWTQEQLSRPLSASTDTTAIVWDGIALHPQLIFRDHTTAIEALAIRGTTVATASHGGLARVWSTHTGHEIHGYYAQSQHALRAIAFSPTGNLTLAGDDGVVAVWPDGNTCQQEVRDRFGLHCVDTPHVLPDGSRPIHTLAFSPNGSLLAVGDTKRLSIWSMPHMVVQTISQQVEGVTALAWSPTGTLLAGACGSRVLLWRFHH